MGFFKSLSRRVQVRKGQETPRISEEEQRQQQIALQKEPQLRRGANSDEYDVEFIRVTPENQQYYTITSYTNSGPLGISGRSDPIPIGTIVGRRRVRKKSKKVQKAVEEDSVAPSYQAAQKDTLVQAPSSDEESRETPPKYETINRTQP